eukprot:s279_g17.t1
MERLQEVWESLSSSSLPPAVAKHGSGWRARVRVGEETASRPTRQSKADAEGDARRLRAAPAISNEEVHRVAEQLQQEVVASGAAKEKVAAFKEVVVNEMRKKREELTKRQKEQQLWAARFMSEKLTKLGKQKAKEIMDVREGVITRIQQRFRSYREDMIFDRTYPLSSSMMSRVQQAKVGRHLDFTMQTVSADDVCHVSLYREVADPKSRKAWETWKKDKEVLRSMTPAYSALHDGYLPVQPALVYASDNLSALFFSERSAAEAPSAFDKTDWLKSRACPPGAKNASLVLRRKVTVGALVARDRTESESDFDEEEEEEEEEGDPGYVSKMAEELRRARRPLASVGSVLEFPATGAPKGLLAFLLTKSVKDETGLWLEVSVLGAEKEETKKSYQKFKSRRRGVHVCYPRTAGSCHPIGDELGRHLRTFRWYPPGDYAAEFLSGYAVKKVKEGPAMELAAKKSLAKEADGRLGRDARSELRERSPRVSFSDPPGKPSRPGLRGEEEVQIREQEEEEIHGRCAGQGGRDATGSLGQKRDQSVTAQAEKKEQGEEQLQRFQSLELDRQQLTAPAFEEELEGAVFKMLENQAYDFLALDGVIDNVADLDERSQRPKSLDLFREGKLDALAGLLSARLMAVETAMKQGCATARHLEISVEEDGPTPAHVLLAARKHGQQIEKAGGAGSSAASQTWPRDWPTGGKGAKEKGRRAKEREKGTSFGSSGVPL